MKRKADGNSGGGDGKDFARELKDMKTLVAIIIIAVSLAALGVSFFYMNNQADGSSGSKTLAGKFWDMPYNLTVDQGTIPWFKEPTLLSWLLLICGVPAAFASLWGLLKVENDLKMVASSISNVFSVTDVRDSKTIGINMTQPDANKIYDTNKAGVSQGEMLRQKKETLEKVLTPAKETIGRDSAAIEKLKEKTRTYMDQVQHTITGLENQYAAMDQVQCTIIGPSFTEFKDQYAGITSKLETLRIDMRHLDDDLTDIMNAIKSRYQHLTAIKKLEETTRTYMDQVQHTIIGLEDQYAAMDKGQYTINGPSFKEFKDRYAAIINELETLRIDMSRLDQDLTPAISSYASLIADLQKENKEKHWYQPWG